MPCGRLRGLGFTISNAELVQGSAVASLRPKPLISAYILRTPRHIPVRAGICDLPCRNSVALTGKFMTDSSAIAAVNDRGQPAILP